MSVEPGPLDVSFFFSFSSSGSYAVIGWCFCHSLSLQARVLSATEEVTLISALHPRAQSSWRAFVVSSAAQTSAAGQTLTHPPSFRALLL